MPMYDLNQAPDQREFGASIPNGSFVLLKGIIKPGGDSHPGDPPGSPDIGLYKKSKAQDSDVLMLEWDFVVIHGPHAGRHVFENMVVLGGKVDEKGQSIAGDISRGRLKAMLNSAMGLDHKDASPQAVAARQIPAMTNFSGIEPVVVRIGIEHSEQYGDKNIIDYILQPHDPEYADARAGKDVPPKPGAIRQNRGAGGPATAAADSGVPAWQRAAAPATAPPVAAAAPASVAPKWGAPVTAAPPQAAPAAPPATVAPVAATDGPAPSWLKQ